MSDLYPTSETMSPDEKFTAVRNLKQKLEENFVALGQLLSDIRRTKLFRFKGYDNFRDFIEAEYNINGSLANKLSATFELFIEEMDEDENRIKEIGFDRLQMIRPLVKKADWETRDKWIEVAESTPTNDLREQIKEIRKQEKTQDKDLKQVYIEQYMEKMLAWFNCSSKELNFKLALFFQDADLDHVKKVIKERQRLFEMQLPNSKED
ncbi:MAG: hypothetical protein PHI68_02265 [Candidatus Cloacimonetes bacterium]|nr:hypothetical protein [Candidatus Cloacimonadota bacterium]